MNDGYKITETRRHVRYIGEQVIRAINRVSSVYELVWAMCRFAGATVQGASVLPEFGHQLSASRHAADRLACRLLIHHRYNGTAFS